MANFLQRFSIGFRKVNISGVPTSGTYVLGADQMYLDGSSLGGGVLESVDLGFVSRSADPSLGHRAQSRSVVER